MIPIKTKKAPNTNKEIARNGSQIVQIAKLAVPSPNKINEIVGCLWKAKLLVQCGQVLAWSDISVLQ